LVYDKPKAFGMAKGTISPHTQTSLSVAEPEEVAARNDEIDHIFCCSLVRILVRKFQERLSYEV